MYRGKLRMRLASGLVAVACGITHVAQAEDAPPIGQFRLPEGLEVQVWASAPMFFDPTNIDVDHRGRIWVAEGVNYRRFNGRPDAQIRHDKGDRIMVLEDTDGDGRADRSHVFVQDPDLVSPLGIAVFDNQVVVSCSPSVLVFTDVDRDGKFDPAVDKKEKLLTGFGGLDHDHGLHATVSGPDGAWYLATGNAGPHVVADRSGWTLRAGSGYTGGSPHNAENQPGLVSDDGRVWVGGVALRFQPAGTGLTVVGHNFRNCYELCVDSLGDVFQNDNDDTVSCRTTWLMEYGNTGYFSTDGARTWQADHRPGQSVPTAHWRQDDPGVIPAGDIYGPGAPTGIARYENGALGDKFAGLLLSCEAGRNVVWGYVTRPSGAGIALERQAFCSSVDKDDSEYRWKDTGSDVRKWFRPSDVCVGADGAVYIADWFDPIVGGHQKYDREGTGTIYRIVAKGTKPQTPKIDLAAIEGQLAALASPANNVRYLGFSRLAERGEAVLPRVAALVQQENEFVAARAVYLAARLGAAGRQHVEKLLADPSERIRLVAFRALRRAGVDVVPLATRLCDDPSPAVRREIALAMRDIPHDRCQKILLAVAEGFDGTDRWYLEALGTGCEGKEEAIYEALVGKDNEQATAWNDRLAAIAWRLHPKAAIEPLRQRALASTLPQKSRMLAIDTIAFIADPAAAAAMQEIADNDSGAPGESARWWLARRRDNLWREFSLPPEESPDEAVLRAAGFQLPKEPVYESETILPGRTARIDVDITGAKHLYLVAAGVSNGIHCDWTDWIEPRLAGPTGEIPLTDLRWKRAFAEWGEVLVGKSCAGLPLQVGGKAIADGIGTHANSVIVYDLTDRKVTRFRAHAGIDDGRADLGGATYPGSRSSIVVRVFHDGPSPGKRAAEMASRLLHESTPQDERVAIAKEMANCKEGGLQLVALASQNRLSPELVSVVAGEIHRNPDIAVRAIAGKYFRRTTAEGEPLPSIEQLAGLRGDAARGRELFGGRASCQKCHRIAGEGASIGPDLTQIHRKFDRSRLLDAIVNPSASILFGYETWIISTADGRVITGSIIGEGDPVLIADTNGKQHSIPKDEIDERRRLPLSIMPEIDSLDLAPQDLADVAEYLLSLRGKEGAP